jgi:DNA (cytosine-5)-methyltransferase 1
MIKGKIRFVDLFAGIGGFHQAITNVFPDAECVWASEKDFVTARVYKENFGIDAYNDITKFDEREIPSFDLLCAGFPCQPFSKGGDQKGFDDIRGTLFFDIVRILRYHKPKYILLENVANLINHDEGNTYKVILKSLHELGYVLPENPIKISPDELGLPMQRPRVFLPGILTNKLKSINLILPEKRAKITNHISDDFKFDEEVKDKSYNISAYEKRIIKMWDQFYKGINKKTIGFPVWYDYFKYAAPPSHYPEWKQKFVEKNISLYRENKRFIDSWEKKYKNLNWVNNTHRKFEWQCGTDYNSIYDCLIQFRPSGVRVKRPTNFSTLVAMNHGQIVGWLLRRLTVNEVKQLQGFPVGFKLENTIPISMKQLGNAVNVKVVETIISQIVK